MKKLIHKGITRNNAQYTRFKYGWISWMKEAESDFFGQRRKEGLSNVILTSYSTQLFTSNYREMLQKQLPRESSPV